MWKTKKTRVGWVGYGSGSVRNWRRGEYDRNTLYKTLKKTKRKRNIKKIAHTETHAHTFNIKSHAINFLRENTADTKDNGAGKVLFTNPTNSGWGALRVGGTQANSKSLPRLLQNHFLQPWSRPSPVKFFPLHMWSCLRQEEKAPGQPGLRSKP